MKRWLPLGLVVMIGLGALFYSQRHHAESQVGPGALLNWIADTQREISRVPMRVTRLSDAEEISIGEGMASRASEYLRRPWNPDIDPAIEEYIQKVGRQVSARAKRKLDYKFHYIPNDHFINAFALPGGHVFIGKGLMLLMDSEDELAAILGHEVEHIDHYHCAERLQVQARLKNIPLSGLVSLPIALFQAGYSKEQELEADRDGTLLAVKASYSAEGAVRMFEAFARLQREYVNHASNPQHELSQVALETLTGYFRSHPLPDERKRQIEDMMDREHWPPRAERPLKIRLSKSEAMSTPKQ